MCNAHNHSRDCTCGFGGEGHAGRRTYEQGFLRSLFRAPRSYDSYLNPNASCPVCGASVFFYQSESGGRVYFEECGPPWPKHPCTDKSQQLPLDRPRSEPRTSSYSWQAQGWRPVLDASASSYTPELFRITGKTGESDVTVFVRKKAIPSLVDLRDLLTTACIHMKDNSDGSKTLSLFGETLEPLSIQTFTSEFEAAKASTLPGSRPLRRVQKAPRR